MGETCRWRVLLGEGYQSWRRMYLPSALASALVSGLRVGAQAYTAPAAVAAAMAAPTTRRGVATTGSGFGLAMEDMRTTGDFATARRREWSMLMTRVPTSARVRQWTKARLGHGEGQ